MKQYRTLIVLLVAVVAAGVAAFGVYASIQRMPVREVEVGSIPVVVAAESIPVGTRLTTDQSARGPLAGTQPGARRLYRSAAGRSTAA